MESSRVSFDLIMVCGPPTSGKSTLLSASISNTGHPLWTSISADGSREWRLCNPSEIREANLADMRSVVVHYDLSNILIEFLKGNSAVFQTCARYPKHQGALRALENADSVKCVTLMTSPRRLCWRLSVRLLDHLYFLTRNGWPAKYGNIVRREAMLILLLMTRSERLAEFYTKWFEYVQQFQAEVWIYDGSENGQFTRLLEEGK